MRAFFSLCVLANLANPALLLWTTLFALSGMPGTAFAALDEIGRAPPSTHRLKFIVDPELAADIGPAEAARRLAQYVADVNTVFTRETVRSFSFDPAADL